jgi:hypothetical protein
VYDFFFKVHDYIPKPVSKEDRPISLFVNNLPIFCQGWNCYVSEFLQLSGSMRFFVVIHVDKPWNDSIMASFQWGSEAELSSFGLAV